MGVILKEKILMVICIYTCTWQILMGQLFEACILEKTHIQLI